VVLYQMCMRGELPFKPDYKLHKRIVKDVFEPVTGDYSDGLKDLINACLQKNP
jgi:hypothetical protein